MEAVTDEFHLQYSEIARQAETDRLAAEDLTQSLQSAQIYWSQKVKALAAKYDRTKLIVNELVTESNCVRDRTSWRLRELKKAIKERDVRLAQAEIEKKEMLFRFEEEKKQMQLEYLQKKSEKAVAKSRRIAKAFENIA